MNTKLKLTLIALVSIASISTIGLTLIHTSKDSIHTNEVYYASPTTSQSEAPSSEATVSDETSIDEASIDKDYYSSQCQTVIKQYFDIDISTEAYNIEVTLIDKDFIDKKYQKNKEDLQHQVDNNEISQEDMDSILEAYEWNYNDSLTQLDTFGTPYIQCRVEPKSHEHPAYSVDFRADNQKLILIFLHGLSNSIDNIPTATEQEITQIGVDFIKAHQLEGIQTPKLEYISMGTNPFVYFTDENDPSKRAALLVNPTSQKVFTFYLEVYADFMMNH